jgi:hypothetical protein
MIALIGLRPATERCAGTVTLQRLPAPPASRYTGAIVRCVSTDGLEEALCWYAGIRAARPTFSLGVVTPPEIGVGPLARCTQPVSAVASPADLAGDRISTAMLEAVRAGSLEGQIFEELIDRYGAGILAERQLLECVIARAAGGGTLQRVADDLGVHRDTVCDRLAMVGCRAVDLRGHVRHRAYEIRVASGASPAEARIAGGWHSREARRKCAQRLRGRHSE